MQIQNFTKNKNYENVTGENGQEALLAVNFSLLCSHQRY